INKLKEGIQLEVGIAKFNCIKFSGGEGAYLWYYVTLSEGRNREVRRMFEALGVTVSRLTRIRFGDIILPKFVSLGTT
ncbi:23S rRNA pseudouridine(2605) synthase RluB, partial [Francisella tularensis subsp. holarctica]|nr:23S rRNA pseudouridine(2605) synthase RluB [Francisella tularensis subsp. holarctica]